MGGNQSGPIRHSLALARNHPFDDLLHLCSGLRCCSSISRK
jgi:hypothetical protein